MIDSQLNHDQKYLTFFYQCHQVYQSKPICDILYSELPIEQIGTSVLEIIIGILTAVDLLATVRATIIWTQE